MYGIDVNKFYTQLLPSLQKISLLKMKSQELQLQNKIIKSSGLQELHIKKLVLRLVTKREDQKVFFRKIFIWLFVFACIYIAFVEDAPASTLKAQPSISQEYSVPTEEISVEFPQEIESSEIKVTGLENEISHQEKIQVNRQSQETQQQTAREQQLVQEIKSEIQTEPTYQSPVNQFEQNPSPEESSQI